MKWYDYAIIAVLATGIICGIGWMWLQVWLHRRLGERPRTPRQPN